MTRINVAGASIYSIDLLMDDQIGQLSLGMNCNIMAEAEYSTSKVHYRQIITCALHTHLNSSQKMASFE